MIAGKLYAENIETQAEQLHRRAGMDPAGLVVPVHLAGELLGWRNVVEVADLPCVAEIRNNQLLLRAGEFDAAHDHHTARALARWTLERPASAETIDRLARAIQAPREAVLNLARGRDFTLDLMAEGFLMSRTEAAARYTEVMGIAPPAPRAQVISLFGGVQS